MSFRTYLFDLSYCLSYCCFLSISSSSLNDFSDFIDLLPPECLPTEAYTPLPPLCTAEPFLCLDLLPLRSDAPLPSLPRALPTDYFYDLLFVRSPTDSDY